MLRSKEMLLALSRLRLLLTDRNLIAGLGHHDSWEIATQHPIDVNRYSGNAKITSRHSGSSWISRLAIAAAIFIHRMLS